MWLHNVWMLLLAFEGEMAPLRLIQGKSKSFKPFSVVSRQTSCVIECSLMIRITAYANEYTPMQV